MNVIRKLFLPVVLILLFFSSTCLADKPFYQYSTIDSLLAGNYDGELTAAGLKKKGNFGLGTFNSLNGEMVLLEGKVYRVSIDGTAAEVKDSERIPFAAATFFKTGAIIKIEQAENLEELNKIVSEALPTENIFYAIRIDGRFETMRTRSVPAQEKPYPPLVEAIKEQSVFKFTNVEGSLVGLRSPSFVKGIGVPGYHWHFLTNDRKAGGHVLDCQFKNLVAKTSSFNNFLLELPEDKKFFSTDFSEDKQKELKKVEK